MIFGGYNFATMSFNELITTFANNLFPILLVSSAGFVLGKLLTVDSRSLGRVVFYVFSPLLVFDLMIIGLVIYFLYSSKHSKLRNAK